MTFSSQQREEFRDAFLMDDVPLFKRKLAEPLQAKVWTVSIPAWGYRWIKDKLRRSVEHGVIYSKDSLPPEDIMNLSIKERLAFEWRWRHLLRVQKRLSFWLAYTGMSEEELTDAVSALYRSFLPEIVDVRLRRSWQNAARRKSDLPSRFISAWDGNTAVEMPLQEILEEITEHRKRAHYNRLAWHMFTVAYGKGLASYAVQSDTRKDAFFRLIRRIKRGVSVQNYERGDTVPSWIKRDNIIKMEGKDAENELVRSSSTPLCEVEGTERVQGDTEKVEPVPVMGDDLL